MSVAVDPTVIPIEHLLRAGVLQPAFQPIVDLATSSVVAYEALARWPGVPGATPDVVFADAAAQNRTAELDWACRTAAISAALLADPSGMGGRTLFVNVEPASAGTAPTPEATAALTAADGRLRVMYELTERALFTHPAELMGTVEAARARGFGIALDDVGVDPASLAMLPFVAPDVIKLDMSLIQGAVTSARARVMTAVMAHAERTGATVLAEGIETAEHVELAQSLGATLGQGWYFGRPGPITALAGPTMPVRFAQAYESPPETPYDLVSERDDVRIGRKPLLLAFSRFIETQARAQGAYPVVLGAFQTAERFTPATSRRYADLAHRSPFVGALGQGLSPRPVPGVRGGDLAADDPLVGEWTVVVVGDHYAGALIARDLGDPGPEHERRFEFALTHDRDTVLAAGRSLLSRLLPI